MVKYIVLGQILKFMNSNSKLNLCNIDHTEITENVDKIINRNLNTVFNEFLSIKTFHLQLQY